MTSTTTERDRAAKAKAQQAAQDRYDKLAAEVERDAEKLAEKRTRLLELKKAAGVKAHERIDWLELLKELPETFRASDLKDRVFVHTGVMKQASQIYAAINRWLKSGIVKRSKAVNGAYEITPKGYKQIPNAAAA